MLHSHRRIGDRTTDSKEKDQISDGNVTNFIYSKSEKSKIEITIIVAQKIAKFDWDVQ